MLKSINYRNGGATFNSYKNVVGKDYLLVQRYVGSGTSGEMYIATVSDVLKTIISYADSPPATAGSLQLGTTGNTGGIEGTFASYAGDGTLKLLTLVGARSDILTDVTSIGSSGGSITINASSGVTFTGNIYASNIVNTFNGLTGAVGITAGSNITLTPSGNVITISSSGGGGTGSNFTEGITAPSTPTKGDRWFNTADGGLYTAITDDSGVIWTQLNAGILGPTGATGSINVSAGAGITISNSVISIDTVGGVTFTGPIRGSTLYLTGDLIVTGQIITSTGIFGATANNIIESVDNMIMDGGEF